MIRRGEIVGKRLTYKELIGKEGENGTRNSGGSPVPRGGYCVGLGSPAALSFGFRSAPMWIGKGAFPVFGFAALDLRMWNGK